MLNFVIELPIKKSLRSEWGLLFIACPDCHGTTLSAFGAGVSTSGVHVLSAPPVLGSQNQAYSYIKCYIIIGNPRDAIDAIITSKRGKG